jgi:hypothetical protein
MRKLLFLGIALSVLSCKNNELKLPLLAEPGVYDIQNHSQVWFFPEVKDGDTIARINRNNTISSTHWIYNIDRNLNLNQVIPHLIDLQEKHHGSMHSQAGMMDYLSYADTLNNRISLLPIDRLEYRQVNMTEILWEIMEDPCSQVLRISHKAIAFNDEELSREHLEEVLAGLAVQTNQNCDPKLTVYYSDRINYSRFLDIKSYLHRWIREKKEWDLAEIIVDERP